MTERGAVVRRYAWERCDQGFRPVGGATSARTNRRNRTGRVLSCLAVRGPGRVVVIAQWAIRPETGGDMHEDAGAEHPLTEVELREAMRAAPQTATAATAAPAQPAAGPA